MSRASKEIPELQKLVMGLLVTDKRLRDCDRKLSCRVWAIQLGGIDKVKEITAHEFMCKYAEDVSKLYSQDSIGRCRRKLQELHRELRGAKYESKQSEQGDVVDGLNGMQA